MTLPAAYFDGDGDPNRLDQPSDHHDKHASWQTDASGNVTGLVGPDGNKWMPPLTPGRSIVLLGDSITAQNYGILTITSITRSANIATVDVTAHGSWAGARCQIVNVSGDATINGDHEVLARVDANSFTIASPGADGSITLGSTPRLHNMQRLYDNGAFNWANILLHQRFDVIGLFASSGRTASTVLEKIDDVIELAPSYAWVMCGINDLTGVGGAIKTSAQTIAVIESIYDRLTSSGILVLACTILPMGASYSPSGQTLAQLTEKIIEVNRWIIEYCRSNANTILIDTYAAIVDPMGATKGAAIANSLGADHVHPTALGAYRCGVAAYTALNSVVSNYNNLVTSNADNYGTSSTNSNVLDQAPWVASGGTVSAPVTGTMPTGWVAERTGSAGAVASVPARSDGYGYDCRLDTTAAAANDIGTTRASSSAFASRMAANVDYVIEAAVSVSNVSGSNLSSIQPYITGTVDGVSNIYLGACLHPSGTTQPGVDWSGVVRSPKFKWTGTTTVGSFYVSAYFSAAGTALTHTVGRAAIRIV